MTKFDKVTRIFEKVSFIAFFAFALLLSASSGLLSILKIESFSELMASNYTISSIIVVLIVTLILFAAWLLIVHSHVRPIINNLILMISLFVLLVILNQTAAINAGFDTTNTVTFLNYGFYGLLIIYFIYLSSNGYMLLHYSKKALKDQEPQEDETSFSKIAFGGVIFAVVVYYGIVLFYKHTLNFAAIVVGAQSLINLILSGQLIIKILIAVGIVAYLLLFVLFIIGNAKNKHKNIGLIIAMFLLAVILLAQLGNKNAIIGEPVLLTNYASHFLIATIIMVAIAAITLILEFIKVFIDFAILIDEEMGKKKAEKEALQAQEQVQEEVKEEAPVEETPAEEEKAAEEPQEQVQEEAKEEAPIEEAPVEEEKPAEEPQEEVKEETKEEAPAETVVAAAVVADAASEAVEEQPQEQVQEEKKPKAKKTTTKKATTKKTTTKKTTKKVAAAAAVVATEEQPKEEKPKAKKTTKKSTTKSTAKKVAPVVVVEEPKKEEPVKEEVAPVVVAPVVEKKKAKKIKQNNKEQNIKKSKKIKDKSKKFGIRIVAKDDTSADNAVIDDNFILTIKDPVPVADDKALKITLIETLQDSTAANTTKEAPKAEKTTKKSTAKKAATKSTAKKATTKKSTKATKDEEAPKAKKTTTKSTAKKTPKATKAAEKPVEKKAVEEKPVEAKAVEAPLPMTDLKLKEPLNTYMQDVQERLLKIKDVSYDQNDYSLVYKANGKEVALIEASNNSISIYSAMPMDQIDTENVSVQESPSDKAAIYPTMVNIKKSADNQNARKYLRRVVDKFNKK